MKKILTLISMVVVPGLLCAQSVPTALRISQNDLRGTARFMSMGGAFGALGGDLSALSQNPGGIGIYRSNEIGLTLGLDAMQSQSKSAGLSRSDKMTQFNLNNIGCVFTLKLYNNIMPNLNFGFTYNKGASFNRRFKGNVPMLRNSMSNYIAGLSNASGLTEDDVMTTSEYDPYNPSYGSRYVPWLAVLGYDALLTNPEGDANNPRWYGQYGDGTSGEGYFEVNEKGSVDEYNITIGGNINNVVFWGMDFDITSVDYRIQSIWGESLDNAYVYNPNMQSVGRYASDWMLYDKYRVNGTGFNFKLGVIVKPIQELRLGLAFHTPTYYNLNETYSDTHMAFSYPFKMDYDMTWANNGYPATNSFNFATPWKVIASVAGVIGNNLIVSADYQWDSYSTMRYSDADMYGYYDPWYDWDNPWSDWGGWYGAPSSRSNGRVDYMNANDYANSKIKEIYRDTHTLRLGAEFRIIPNFSIRAGYSFSSSPVTTKAKNDNVEIPGTGVMTNYSLDNTTNYVTCGVGYKHKGFYVDFAYVYKYMTSEYYPFSPDILDMGTAVKSKLSFNNSSMALTLGYKF